MKNLKKKALVSAIAGVFAFGAGFYAAPNTSLPSLTIMQAAADGRIRIEGKHHGAPCRHRRRTAQPR